MHISKIILDFYVTFFYNTIRLKKGATNGNFTGYGSIFTISSIFLKYRRRMNFDTFLDLFHEELTHLWTNSIHYFTTDFGRFVEIKYEAFLKKGKF